MFQIYGPLVQHIFFPALLLPTRSQSARLARQMRRRQYWSVDRFRNWQLEQLKKLLQIAESDSPLYRRRFSEAGVCSHGVRDLNDLAKFPLTTKADIESNFPDGMVVAERRTPDWQYVGTRGTTHRVMVVQDYQRRDVGRAAGLVVLTEDSPYCLGAREVTIPPDACSIHCGIESNRERSVSRQIWSLASGKIAWGKESVSDLRGLVMDGWIRRSLTLPPLMTDGGDDECRSYVSRMRELKPTQLTALPEYLRVLADYIDRTGDAPPPIPVIRPMGANMPVSWKEPIAAAFRGMVREHYGSREMGPMAFDCRHADGMHLVMDRHVIEVIRNGRHVEPGEVGQVVITDLDNFAMPIVRYQIGDLARLDRTPCPCGRNTPRIYLEGRLEDAIVTDHGRILTAESVSNFFAVQPGVRDFQLTEDRQRRWTLRVVEAEENSIDVDALGVRFLEWAAVARQLSVRIAKNIRPESSGKFRHSKSHSFHTLLEETAQHDRNVPVNS